jgi:hypothetical protein
MRLPSIFRLPKYHVFDYKPRFWDPRKENLEIKIEQAKKELAAPEKNSETSQYKPSIKGRIRPHIGHRFQATKKKADKAANTRFFIILIILLAFMYFLFLK